VATVARAGAVLVLLAGTVVLLAGTVVLLLSS